ncbi:DUF4350 domain-containing protein [Desertivirga xinjiangensis]|uniref:DUF4350 domain-containing protein n=1 Tax=Desertivirga xinjiangensis TaxID=539206 RepID=UPI0021099B9B|nr:DUF4350 domain-containing protein [Pedobacter xinjiangensis]
MKDLKIYAFLGFLFLAIYLLAQYNRPKPVDWKESFSKKDKIPFGTFVFYERLKDIFPQAEIKAVRTAPYTTFEESAPGKGSYILVAKAAKVDEYDFEHLKKYMEQGNNVLIATYYPGKYLEDSLKLKISTELKLKTKQRASIYFTDSALDSARHYTFDKGIGEQYFSSYDTSRTVILGKNNRGHANFIKYNYGKGALYLLPGPFFFTNYNILKPEGAEYAEKTLSYLPTDGQIVWDEFSALGSEGETSMMRVFLKHKELKWAYYLALFSLFLFVVYEIKRRQRIIPVIKPLENTSVEFAEIVGQVYYQRRDNSNIARKQVTYFLEGIRARYNIKTGALNAEFTDTLAQKSGVSRQLIEVILGQAAQISKYQTVSDTELIELNKNIEQFNQQSK